MIRKRQPRLAIVLVTVLAALTTGCRSSQEYQRLAKAGNSYTEAMDSLLTTAGQIKIDATSEQLLKDDQLKNQNFDNYNELSQLDVERLEILEELRRHNRLLTRYFNLLDELASSNAPERAQKEIEGIAGNLNKIGTELRSLPLISNTTGTKSLGSLVISSQIRGALREELAERKDIINVEFQTQQVLLEKLSNSIKQDIAQIKEARELRLVIRPLVEQEAISNAEEWIETRRKILTMSRTASDLEEASKSAGQFRSIFQDFVEGKLNRDRLNTLLADIESFITIIEQIKNS